MKRKHRERIAAERAAEQAAAEKPSYTGVKILAGILGIMLTIAIVVYATTSGGDATDTQNAGGSVPVRAAPAQPTAQGGVQEVRMAVERFSYNPSTITVQAGTPVKWIVDGTGSSGCTQYLLLQDFGVSRRLIKGENIIEFTPTKKGTYSFTCGMGMVKGTLKVV